MPITTGKELRQAYLEFFNSLKTHPHPIVASAPLVPPDDPTLLFTSAGMVQFKALYSGTVELPYPRAASCQKCLRAGGKGSDLENVGRTLRHHTFFEMLGNFSFGDYFKRESILFAWDFCTSAQWMNLPKERLFPTIYGPTVEQLDTEAFEFWREAGSVNPPIPLDESENFWGPAGETGACGPCSEVKFFLGTDEQLRSYRAQIKADEFAALSAEDALRKYREVLASGAFARIQEDVVKLGDDFLEIWNMVFPQYDQQKDGSRPLLKNKGIDTGAGLERMTVALNFAQTGIVSTPYETDLLWPITSAVAKATGVRYVKVAETTHSIQAENRLRVNAIADHIRTLVFCLAEGITPGNVGRSYVVRRIARRALRFASLLGVKRPILAELYDSVVEAMGEAYPEIKKNPDFIRKALHNEEETFLRTRDRGQKILDELIAQAKQAGATQLSGEDVFRLWDTDGFPSDMTEEIALEAGLGIDRAGYEKALAKAREESKKSWKGAKSSYNEELLDAVLEKHGQTEFLGFGNPAPVVSEVLALIRLDEASGGEHVDALAVGEDALVVLRQTPFYAEGGGQIGDRGVIAGDDAKFAVVDTQKSPQGIFIHRGQLESGVLTVGQTVTARVDRETRERIRRNHSSVHLLQSALKRLVGEHITQAGSYVGPDYCRFDFTHSEPITREQLRAVQKEVNRLILQDSPVVTDVLPIDEARARGAIAPFGEKYGATVRVVQMGKESIEFCGGTHVDHTSQIGHFRIISEGSIASGVRRIEATAGSGAVELELAEQYDLLQPLQAALAVKGPETLLRIEQMAGRIRELEKEVARLRRDAALRNVDVLVSSAVALPHDAKLVATRADGLDSAELRALATALRDKLGDGAVVVLFSANGDKVSVLAAVGKAAQANYPAGTIVNKLAAPLEGKGGGKPDMAQAGARFPERIDGVLAKVASLLGS